MAWYSNLFSSSSTQSPTAKKGEKVHLYISIDSTRVCFLSIDENQKPNKIVSREEVPLGPLEDKEPGEPVRDLFGTLLKVFTAKKEKLEGNAGVSVSIPAEGVFFKNVEVPKLGDNETQKLILAEVKKSLPVDFSQILFAQNDLGEKHEGKKSFFCVGVQKVIFENFKNVFLKFNLAPYFEIEVFSLARIVKRDGQPKLVIQIGRINTFLIFTDGQIIQDVKLLDVGENDLNRDIGKEMDLKFGDVELLKNNFTSLLDNNRMGGQVVDEYVKLHDKKIADAVSLHILDYEKKMGVEVKEILISGSPVSSKIKKILADEFDSELPVDFVSEENFGDFVAENFTLDELKRYAQCFGLALRAK
jgi:Tfp pilus assembly PilM family ATPase